MNEEEINAEVVRIIRSLAPPFKRVDDDVILAWVEMGRMFVCDTRFRDKYPRALALYTLYIMTENGAMKSEKETIESYSRRVSSFTLSGEFSQTFATLSGNNSDSKRSNPWWVMYDVLNKKSGGGFGLITAATGRCCR